MGRELLHWCFRSGIDSARPPAKLAFGKSFLTKPKTLSVVHQRLDGRAATITKNVDRPRKWVRRQHDLTEARLPEGHRRFEHCRYAGDRQP